MSYSDYFRYPHAKNEMKKFYASSISEVGVFIKIRGRRNPKCLPNSWDDYYRSNMRLRNWKTYRKQQWK
ncbi:hypothetical protein [Microbulbifer sp. ZKSA002]|uniref:hypothetical protein n=1 Tax=Microbulbifer sp. ZKSA002 TaxID=3243388 RepID=UPI00403984D9